MRCPSCEKFVPYDTEQEPEEQMEPAMDGNVFTAEYRRVLSCEECGDELKEALIEFQNGVLPFKMLVVTPSKVQEDHDESWRDAFQDEIDHCGSGRAIRQDWDDDPLDDEHDWEIEVTASPTMGMQTTDRNGKPITNMRYAKTLYGVELSGTVTCSRCGIKAVIEMEESVVASSMDELV